MPLQRRVEAYCRRFPELEIAISPLPLPPNECKLYVIHISRHREVRPDGSVGAAAPVICYGPAAELSTAWSLGCADYLKDPWTPRELHFRAERVLSRSWPVIPLGSVSLSGHTLSGADSSRRLSTTEHTILDLLIRNAGSVVPREGFYYALWGKPGAGSRTVDVHIARLRAALREVQGSVPEELQVRVLGVRNEGYRLWIPCG